MKLHIFNPEHDIALAHNDPFFTPPHAGRQLRSDCGFLPILWAEPNDLILVDDIDAAVEHVRHLGGGDCYHRFVTLQQLENIQLSSIEPWGWNISLRHQLNRAGVSLSLLPSDEQLNSIRTLSHRQTAAQVLNKLVNLSAKQPNTPNLVGTAKAINRLDDLHTLLAERQESVIKEPWSSSGRGVRYVGSQLTEHEANWAAGIIRRQGCIMWEPYYNKVKDFAMEFESTPEGIRYVGLSLFHTTNGAYLGNLIMDETEKWEEIERFISAQQLETIRESIIAHLSPLLSPVYQGPFGIDMMVVARDDAQGFLIHPMVEINLRRTMGHVALSLQQRNNAGKQSLNIGYEDGHYHLHIRGVK